MTSILVLRRIAGSFAARASWIIKGRPVPLALLEMLWPTLLQLPAPAVVLASDYTLRHYAPRDRDRYFGLLASAGMTPCPLKYWEKHILPGGFFVIEHDQSGALVATCMASHHPTARHPVAGNFGWLAADPAHKGRGLGNAVASAVTARLIAGGYKRIYLETHDFRLPAIKIYLSMGWVPSLYQEDMHGRWEAVCANLGWPFTPEAWCKVLTPEPDGSCPETPAVPAARR